MEEDPLGGKLGPMWDAGASSRGLSYYATALAPKLANFKRAVELQKISAKGLYVCPAKR